MCVLFLCALFFAFLLLGDSLPGQEWEEFLSIWMIDCSTIFTVSQLSRSVAPSFLLSLSLNFSFFLFSLCVRVCVCVSSIYPYVQIYISHIQCLSSLALSFSLSRSRCVYWLKWFVVKCAALRSRWHRHKSAYFISSHLSIFLSLALSSFSLSLYLFSVSLILFLYILHFYLYVCIIIIFFLFSILKRFYTSFFSRFFVFVVRCVFFFVVFLFSTVRRLRMSPAWE